MGQGTTPGSAQWGVGRTRLGELEAEAFDACSAQLTAADSRSDSNPWRHRETTSDGRTTNPPAMVHQATVSDGGRHLGADF
jgi:hypothetical protein